MHFIYYGNSKSCQLNPKTCQQVLLSLEYNIAAWQFLKSVHQDYYVLWLVLRHSLGVSLF